MAISFVSYVGGAGTGTKNPGLPAGIADGDVLLLTIEGEGEDLNADNPPAGGVWVAIDGGTGSVASATDGAGDRTRNTTYYCVYDSAAPPATLVPDAGNHTAVVITAWRGCDTTTPIHKYQSSSNATNDLSVSVTGVTTTEDNCMIVAITAAGDNNAALNYPGSQAMYSNWANANLASITEAVDVNGQEGSDWAIGIAYGVLASAGVSGATTVTIAISEEEANWCVALLPAKTGHSLGGKETRRMLLHYKGSKR